MTPLVLLEGIELSTSPLPRECSTTELQQRGTGGLAAFIEGQPNTSKSAPASFQGEAPGRGQE